MKDGTFRNNISKLRKSGVVEPAFRSRPFYTLTGKKFNRTMTHTTWIVTMWHFGVDTIQEYTGKEFEFTFGDGISDLYRVYRKRMKDDRIKVRSENQQYPDQEYADAIVRKFFPNDKIDEW